MFPDHILASSEYKNPNDASVILSVRFSLGSALFTGDAPKEVEREMLAGGAHLKADVLQVGHHGSSSSSDRAFL